MKEDENNLRPPEENPGTIEFAKTLAGKGLVDLTHMALALVPGLLLNDGAPVLIGALRTRADMNNDEIRACEQMASIADRNPLLKEGLLQRTEELRQSTRELLESANRREEALNELS